MQSLELSSKTLEVAPEATRTVCLWPACPVRYAIAPDWQVTPDVTEADAIIVSDSRSLHRLEDLLRAEEKLLTPVIGLDGARSHWLDHAKLSGLAAALEWAKDILQKCDKIDHVSLNESTLLLARMFTRASELRAAYNPYTPEMISYPVGGLLPEIRERAEELAGRGLLGKRFFDRFHVCPNCQSSRLNVREECSACKSARIDEQPIVHHFKCGHEAKESDFKHAGPYFECPKCGERLRHIGLDYDKPGSAVVCQACGRMDDTVAIGFLCMDCNYHQDSERMPTRTWYHYSLTAKGREALFRGDLAGWRNTLVSTDFQASIQQALREAEEFATPFQIIRISAGPTPRAAGIHDRLWDQTRNLMLDCVRRVLRPVDMVVDSTASIMVYLPRTTPGDASERIEQIKGHFAEVLRTQPESEFEILDRQQICDLVADQDPWIS
jgi:hypothetical protein